MSTFKGTPAPWVAREHSVTKIGDTKKTRMCEITCSDNNQIIAEIPDYCHYEFEVDNNMANARLIAAAPELLEALRALCSCINETRGSNADNALFAARLAITKATGEEQ